MSKPKAVQAQIAYGKPEELTNIISHAVGAAAGFAGLVFLMLKTADRGYGASAYVSVFVYGLCMTLVFAVSALYHSMTPGSARRAVLKRFDRCPIAVLVLGVYSPVMLVGMQRGTTADGVWGYVLFAVISAAVILAVTLSAVDALRFKACSLTAFVIIGLACVVRIDRIAELCGSEFFWFLLGGAAAYMIGIILSSVRKFPYSHSLMHIFALVGAALHFAGVYVYLL